MPRKPDRFICKTCDQTYMSARELVQHITEVRAQSQAAERLAREAALGAML